MQRSLRPASLLRVIAVQLTAIASACTVGLDVGSVDVGPPDAAEDAPASACGECPSGVCVGDRCCPTVCGGVCLPARFDTRVFRVAREPRWVFAVDLDEDGRDELVVPVQLDERVEIAWGHALRPGESPTVGTRIPLGRMAAGLSVHDVDGDGRVDLFAIAQGGAPGEEHALRAVRSLGARSFEPLAPLTQPGAPTWVTPLDADRDGTRDLLVRLPTEECIGLRRGHPDGSFDPHVCVVPYASSAEDERIARVDLDGDGVEELLELRRTVMGRRLYVHRFGPDGLVAQTELLAAPLDVEPTRFDLRDLDGDGAQELVTFAGWGDATRALLRTGDGEACELPAGFAVSGELAAEQVTAAGDFDGDGLLDLAGSATCPFCDGDVYLHLGVLDR